MIPARSQAAPHRATWEDIASQPEGDRTEVVDGEHESAPSPLTRHDVARIAPFDAVELDVGRLFPPEEPTEG